MNSQQDKVNDINARATRRTEDIHAAYRRGDITRAERDSDLELVRGLADAEVRRVRRGRPR